MRHRLRPALQVAEGAPRDLFGSAARNLQTKWVCSKPLPLLQSEPSKPSAAAQQPKPPEQPAASAAPFSAAPVPAAPGAG